MIIALVTTTNMDNPKNQNEIMKNCEICDKEVKTKSGLNQHISIIHVEQRENKCNICVKIFHHQCKLTLHMKSVHENKKNHKCDSCGKSFSEAGKLKRH